MRNSKVLKVAVCSALVASLAASAAFGASALTNVDELKNSSVQMGVCGIFTGDLAAGGWEAGADIPMTYNESTGIWEAKVEFDVVDGYITDWTCDGKPAPEGTGIQFKIRTNNDWTDSWGNYDGKNGAYNSQYNYGIPGDQVKVGDHVSFTAYLDTNKNDPLAIEAEEVEEDADPDFTLLAGGVKDLVVTPAGGAATEESSEEPSTEAPAESTPAESTPAETPSAPADTTQDKDTATPATGDTTSAIALVAVVLASLGTAVVMTKKASSKN